MNNFKIYAMSVMMFILYIETFTQQVEIHELIAALSKIAIDGEKRMTCTNDTECLNSQICMGEQCADPCPGSCGIHALCYVKNHTTYCECPYCYLGDPNEKCNKRKGILYLGCMIFGIN